jgi:hypothetical protein
MPFEAKINAQARSRSAIFGLLAAVAHGIQRSDRKAMAAWLRQHGIAVGERGLKDAFALRRERPNDTPVDDPAEQGWVRGSLDADPTKLDLDMALVVFPTRRRTPGLATALRRTERVLRIYDGYDGAMVAVVVYDGARERQRLQSQLEEHDPRLTWIVIRHVDDTSASGTWLSLALKVAEAEGLRT